MHFLPNALGHAQGPLTAFGTEVVAGARSVTNRWHSRQTWQCSARSPSSPCGTGAGASLRARPPARHLPWWREGPLPSRSIPCEMEAAWRGHQALTCSCALGSPASPSASTATRSKLAARPGASQSLRRAPHWKAFLRHRPPLLSRGRGLSPCAHRAQKEPLAGASGRARAVPPAGVASVTEWRTRRRSPRAARVPPSRCLPEACVPAARAAPGPAALAALAPAAPAAPESAALTAPAPAATAAPESAAPATPESAAPAAPSPAAPAVAAPAAPAVPAPAAPAVAALVALAVFAPTSAAALVEPSRASPQSSRELPCPASGMWGAPPPAFAIPCDSLPFLRRPSALIPRNAPLPPLPCPVRSGALPSAAPAPAPSPARQRTRSPDPVSAPARAAHAEYALPLARQRSRRSRRSTNLARRHRSRRM